MKPAQNTVLVNLSTLAVALALTTAIAAAAEPSGSLVGSVTDPTGRAVAGATVTARNLATNQQRATLTGAEGSYWVPFLTPGNYGLQVSAPGFRTELNSAVRVDVDETVRADFSLVLGELNQRIVVTDAPQPIRTDDSTIGHTITDRSIIGLPLNQRNFLSFSLLVPGAQLPPDGSQNSVDGVTVSVNGAREQENNFLLDGTDNNDQSINGYSALPSVDAIREFQVQAANSSAEYGRNGGAQINVVLRSGTNQLHGDLFEFLRNRHLDAKNFFDLPDCQAGSLAGTCGSIPRLDRNQFGGTLGGPIVKNKTFYFVSAEGLISRQAVTRIATVPSLIDRSSALSAVPAAFRNPAGVAVLDLYPAPNAGSNLATSTEYLAQPVLRQTAYQPLIKIDQQLSQNDSLAFHYSLYDSSTSYPYDPFYSFTNLPGYGTNYPTRGQNTGINWIHVLSPRTVNEFRPGYNRFSGGILQQNAGQDFSAQLGFPSVAQSPIDRGYPNVILPGFDSIGDPTNTPQHRYDNTIQASDTFAWDPAFWGGRHQIKLGFDIRDVRLNFFLDPLARGEWQFTGALTGNPLVDLLYGLPTVAVAVSGNSATSLRTASQDYFVQDDIHVTDRLTVNLGLRYEFNSPPVEAHNRFSVPNLSPQSLSCSPQPDCQYIVAGTDGVPRATFPATYTDLGPRVGLAWRPLHTNKVVVRSGYGIFYDVGILNLNTGPRFNAPQLTSQVYVTNGFSSIQNIISQSPIGAPTLPEFIASNYRDPMVQQWNFDVQGEISRGLVLDAAYVGTAGAHLIDRRNTNQPQPGAAPPYPEFGPFELFESGASSIYHSLQVRGEQKVRNGLSFLASYTWSKSIDDASTLFANAAEPGFPQNSNDLQAERGLSDFNAGQRFVLSAIYNLPFGPGRQWLHSGVAAGIFGGWNASAIWTAQSGRPFTVTRGVDQSGTGNSQLGIFSDRPNVIANPFVAGPVMQNPNVACHSIQSQGGLAADQVRVPGSWFNPCAFSAVAGAFGNEGRNALIGPGLINLDFALLRDISLTEGKVLQARFEFFNLSNHPNFDTPNANFDSASFGQVLSSNAYGTKPPRQIQLGLKFIF
jgi:hypothetical protein